MKNDSPKIFIRHFFIFYIKVAVIHTFTYIIVGMLFSNFVDFSTVYSNIVVVNFMRDFNSLLTVIAPFLQPVRAIFIAIALYPLRSIIASKSGWLKLWIIFLFIGIISSPVLAPGSIEGIIYTQIPTHFHLINLPELVIQTFLFSIILWIVELAPDSEKEFSNRVFLLKIIFSLFLSIVGMFFTAVSGIVIMNFLEISYENIKLDKGVISYLTAISILTIIVSYSFGDKANKNKLWLLLIIPLFLLIYVGFPYGYNYLFNTAYNNEMALIPYSLSGILMSIIYYIVFVLAYGKLKSSKNKNDNAAIVEENKDEEETINPADAENENKEDDESIK